MREIPLLTIGAKCLAPSSRSDGGKWLPIFVVPTVPLRWDSHRVLRVFSQDRLRAFSTYTRSSKAWADSPAPAPISMHQLPVGIPDSIRRCRTNRTVGDDMLPQSASTARLASTCRSDRCSPALMSFITFSPRMDGPGTGKLVVVDVADGQADDVRPLAAQCRFQLGGWRARERQVEQAHAMPGLFCRLGRDARPSGITGIGFA